MPSASYALRSKWIGKPNEFVPSTTVSISDRIGQPTAASVTPSSAKRSRCPSGVPPPWLPIAATTNGSNPSERSTSTVARTIRAIPWIPRLPAVIAMLLPRCNRAVSRLAPIASEIAALTSATSGCR